MISDMALMFMINQQFLSITGFFLIPSDKKMKNMALRYNVGSSYC